MRFLTGVLMVLFLLSLGVAVLAQTADGSPVVVEMHSTVTESPSEGTGQGSESSTPAEPAKDEGKPAADQTEKEAGASEPSAKPAEAAPKSETKPAQTTPVAAAASPSKNADMKISMAFDKADINSVVKFLSQTSGVPIVCDPSLSGQISIVNLKQIPLSQAFEVVNAALRVRGFAMVGGLDSTVIRVTPLKKAIADSVRVESGKDPAKIAPADNLLTQVIGLEYASATKLKDELKPLISEDQASIVAIASTNTLIITDNGGNVHRLAQIIQELDQDTSDLILVEIYQCKYSSSEALVETLNKIFPPKQPAGPQPGQPQPRGPDGQPLPPPKSDDGLVSLKGELRVSADTRTNSVIISATRQKIDMVLVVLNKLDIDTTPEVKGRTFKLKHADAKMVADQLNKLFEQPQGSGGGEARRSPWDYYSSRDTAKTTGYAGLKRNIIVADVRTNSVIVTATEQNMREFEKMINELDAPGELGDITRAFSLKYAKAPDLAQTLNSLFRGETQRRSSFFDFYFGGGSQPDEGSPLAALKNITVVAEPATNTLLVTAQPQAFAMVQKLIDSLDKRTPQVYIEVAVVDVTLDDNTKFGVEFDWMSATKRPDGSSEQTGSTEFDLSKQLTGVKYSVISDNLQSLFKALETRSNVKVYSTPRITTADNVKAKISIGQDVPFVQSETETTGGNLRRTVDFKNVAVSLEVTPHINEATDWVSLEVLQTVNEIVGRESVLNSPIIANRTAQTSISVKDGQTIVIGGIMKENRTRTSKGVPLLSRIPLVGELFKSHDNTKQKSELMVFLTPHILRDEIDVDQITDQAKDGLSAKPKISPAPTGG